MIQLYVDVIIYPYPTPNASVVSLLSKRDPENYAGSSPFVLFPCSLVMVNFTHK